MTNESFVTILQGKAVTPGLSHIFVCGPPKMNSVMRDAISTRVDSNHYTVL